MSSGAPTPSPPRGAKRPSGKRQSGNRRSIVGKTPAAPGGALTPDTVFPELPHERDEAAGDTAEHPDPIIRQAKKDLDAGLVDTDLRATPGLDAQRRAHLTRRGAK